MTGQTLQQELQRVEPGRRIRDIRSRGTASRVEHGLRLGVVNEGPLTSDGVSTWVTTDSGTSHPHGLFALGLEKFFPGAARIGIDPRVEDTVLRHPSLVRAALSSAMHHESIAFGIIEPDAMPVDIPREYLQAIGFQALQEGDGMLGFRPDREI